METTPTHTYAPPVDQLLTLGECRTSEWPDYQSMGFGPEHVPELIRLATEAGVDDGEEAWAPIHAWRVLGLLRAEKAVEPLLSVFDEWEELDWPALEIPEVLGRIGPAAIIPVVRFMANGSRDMWARAEVSGALREIALRWPEARDECVMLLARFLDDPDEDEAFNGFIVCELMDLKAVEAAPVIERAFAEDRVDITIPGDWEDVQVKLGLLPARTTPRPYYGPFGGLPIRIVPSRPDPPRHVDARRASKNAAKAAAKRKAEKAARRKNRRRK